MAMNSPGNPDNVTPHSSRAGGFGSHFTWELKPHAYTILELDLKQCVTGQVEMKSLISVMSDREGIALLAVESSLIDFLMFPVNLYAQFYPDLARD